jgi:hypothetical protein
LKKSIPKQKTIKKPPQPPKKIDLIIEDDSEDRNKSRNSSLDHSLSDGDFHSCNDSTPQNNTFDQEDNADDDIEL